MNPAVTIVLPVYNAQRTLRESLLNLLELAESTERRLRVAVVDDGSTDATFEIACELAQEYPQLSVLRQPYQRGLGAALEQVRLRLGVADVIAHDGVGEIDHQELAQLLTSGATSFEPAAHGGASGTLERGSRRPAAPLLQADAAVRRRGNSFRWLRIDEPATPRRKRGAAPVLGAALDGLMPAMTTFGVSSTNG